MRVRSFWKERKPRALDLIAWILLLSHSVTAWVIGWRKSVRMFSRWRLIIFATLMIALSLRWAAHPNQFLKNLRAEPS